VIAYKEFNIRVKIIVCSLPIGAVYLRLCACVSRARQEVVNSYDKLKLEAQRKTVLAVSTANDGNIGCELGVSRR
jgi:hypothetical protein